MSAFGRLWWNTFIKAYRTRVKPMLQSWSVGAAHLRQQHLLELALHLADGEGSVQAVCVCYDEHLGCSHR